MLKPSLCTITDTGRTVVQPQTLLLSLILSFSFRLSARCDIVESLSIFARVCHLFIFRMFSVFITGSPLLDRPPRSPRKRSRSIRGRPQDSGFCYITTVHRIRLWFVRFFGHIITLPHVSGVVRTMQREGFLVQIKL